MSGKIRPGDKILAVNRLRKRLILHTKPCNTTTSGDIYTCIPVCIEGERK